MASNYGAGDWDNYLPVGVPSVAVDVIGAKDHQLEMSSEDEIALAVRDGLKDRYHRITNIYTVYGWPTKYAYHSDCEEIPTEAAHFPVAMLEMYSQPKLKDGIEVMWLKLNETAQDKLYLLLRSAISISEKISYDIIHQCWDIRTSHAEDEVHYILKYYVRPLPDNSRNMMDYLRRGRSQAEMQKCFADDATATALSLDGMWVAAFMEGFHSGGGGQAAVFQLLNSITALLRGLKLPDLPPVQVFHVTSALSKDGFSISSSSISTSDRECSSPDVKRRRTDEEQSPTNGTPKKNSAVKHVGPDVHRQFVDLLVITRDGVTETGKYLILVEIHSAEKTFEQAAQKFLQEMINVLQAQNQVFGLLFSRTSVLLYNAHKHRDGKIVISKSLYPLTKGFSHELIHEFCVPNFQKLILDIFSCIIHGIKYVDA